MKIKQILQVCASLTLFFISANVFSGTKIAIIEFELKDMTLAPRIPAEIKRTASIKPLLEAALKTADYTMVAGDYTIVIDASSNDVEIKLPASPNTGQVFNIACFDSSFVSEVNFNGKNFYSSSSNELIFAGENLKVQYNGTYWVGA